MAGPIRLKTHRVLIDAPREQVFDEMSSVDGSGLQCDINGTSKVVAQDGNDITMECSTKAGWFTYTTVEQVTLEPPSAYLSNTSAAHCTTHGKCSNSTTLTARPS